MGEEGAQNLLINHGFDDRFPIDMIGFIQKLNIKVIPYDFSEMERKEEYEADFLKKGNIVGAVVLNDKEIGIFYNTYSSLADTRTILAYEFAYCCLYVGSGCFGSHIDFRSDIFHADRDNVYSDIDAFAGALLMPEKQVRYSHKHLVIPSSSSIANIFGVPQCVAQKRLKHLRLRFAN